MIGWLSAGSAASTTTSELFLREFRKLGYVAGKNITFERRYADNELDRLPGLADEPVCLKVDVLLTPEGNGAFALKNASRSIPIVLLGPSSNPLNLNL
jgi:putative ABC transport system substrate-binding protein